VDHDPVDMQCPAPTPRIRPDDAFTTAPKSLLKGVAEREPYFGVAAALGITSETASGLQIYAPTGTISGNIGSDFHGAPASSPDAFSEWPVIWQEQGRSVNAARQGGTYPARRDLRRSDEELCGAV
jgi:hypothetical protein